MNNKCNQSCASGFVPVNSNWDFNMDACQSGSGGCRQRQNRSGACEAAENTCRRSRQADCAERTTCQQNTCTGRADCPCQRCAAARASGACPAQGRTADNRGIGMVWAKVQELDQVYDCGSALKAGTLYPALHMPMNGYAPCGDSCGDKCQQIAFAMWELRLYLNTHPDDRDALALLHTLQENCCEPNYATTFLEDVPCTDGTRNPAWRWTQGPWPWEYDANCGC